MCMAGLASVLYLMQPVMAQQTRTKAHSAQPTMAQQTKTKTKAHSAQPTTAQQTKGYTNPIIPGFHPDPSVCMVDSDFYLVTSSFGYFPGVPIFHSRDLIHWEQIGNVLDRESQLWLKFANTSLGIYAPTIRYNDGTYYMITTNVSRQAFGKRYGVDPRGNFFCTATDPAGPWSDPIWLEQGGIDPSLYFEDGRCYFCSNPDNQIMLCEIDPKTGQQLTPSVAISNGSGGRYPEAPHIYKKDGWYYLLLAEGGTEEAHKLTIFRSKSIYGPYDANPANPILTHCNVWQQSNPIHGTGHGDIVQAYDGSWWLVGLAYRPQGNKGGTHHLLGRETFLSPVSWPKDGWPVVNGDGSFRIDNPDTPTLPQVEMPQPASRRDLSKPLGYEFCWLCNPVTDNYKTTSKGLVIKASTDLLDDDGSKRPSFVGLRQQQISGTAETEVILQRAKSGDVAGLTAYMGSSGHYDAVVRQKDDGSQEVALRYTVGNIKGQVTSIPLSGKARKVLLRCTSSPDYYAFAYSADGGKQWQNLGRLETRLISTETQGGFTGLYFGLFAEGNGGEATFSWFEVR